MIAYEDFVAPGTWILEGLPTPPPPPGLERYAPLGRHDSRGVGEARFPFSPMPRALREKILKGAIFALQAAPQQPDCARHAVDEAHPAPDCAQQDSDEVGSLSTGCSSSSSSSRRDRPRQTCRTLSDSGASTSSTLSQRTGLARSEPHGDELCRKPWLRDLPKLPVRYVKKPQRPREALSSFSALGLIA